MTRLKRRLFMGGAVAVAAAGVLVGAPASASAAPTPETFSTYEACEARAAQIRDGHTGAECKLEASGWPPRFYWRLHVYG
jgi:hypothetical protein